MKNILFLLIFFVCYSCNAHRLFKEYSLYHRDKTLNYPKDKILLKFMSDSTGLFMNESKNGTIFNQKFTCSNVNNNFLIIKELDQINHSLISLKQGDTIIVHKNKLHFFYNGDEKYLLSFKRHF